MRNNKYMEPTADCERVIYTPSDFARAELLHLQESGHLTATRPHSSHREHLDSFLLIIITAGSGEVVFKGKTYPLKTGDCAFIDCREAYTHSTGSDPWKMTWVHFYGQDAIRLFSKYIKDNENFVFTPYNTFPLVQMVDEICLLANSNDHIRDIKLHERLTSLLTLVLDEIITYSLQKKTLTKWDSQLMNIRHYFESNFAEKIVLEEVASLFYINKFTMIRYFKEQYGISPMAYLQQVRITKSKELLRFSDISIDEISWKCGFQDGNYFSRIFKKIEHTSPSEYRRNWVTKGEAK